MQDNLCGQVALFTGVVSPITVTVARWLGNEGVRLVFAGPRVDRDSLLEPLLYQFRRDILCMEAEVIDPAAVHRLVANVEAACSRVDMLFHTLGGPSAAGPVDAFSVGTSAIVPRSTPLVSALMCSSSAIQHMARHDRGHVIHLVTRAEVGAIEVERMVLERIRGILGQEQAAGAKVRLSAIYFDGSAASQICGQTGGSASGAGETRLLDDCTDRLLEEDGWLGRVMLEEAVGDMVRQVCGTPRMAEQAAMELIDFHGGVQPSMERHAIQ